MSVEANGRFARLVWFGCMFVGINNAKNTNKTMHEMHDAIVLRREERRPDSSTTSKNENFNKSKELDF